MTANSYFELFTGHGEDAVAYAEGEKVFEAGDPCDRFFVVRSGQVLLHDGDVELELVDAAGIFGEMALIDGSTRSVSATAATDCELVAIDQERFRYLVQEAPYFAQEIMRVMAERLRATTQRLH